MLARDELAQEPQREELDSDDHEQDSERQQRPLADCLAAQLEHCQVDEHREAEHRRDESDSPEEVQWPMAVAPHEGHRQEVEEAFGETGPAVLGAAVFAGAMVDDHLADTEPTAGRKHRHEAVTAHAPEALAASAQAYLEGQGCKVKNLPREDGVLLAANLGFLVRATPGNVGLFQLSYAVAAEPFGAPRDTAIAAALVLQTLQIVPVTLVGAALAPEFLLRRRR